MAETPDTVFKSRCCPNATGISLPAKEYLPGDGIHHFDYRSSIASFCMPRSSWLHLDNQTPEEVFAAINNVRD
jgi:hypothetical protein